MNLHEIAYQLRKLPWLKKHLKDLYQFTGNIISDKQTKTRYPIQRISDSDTEHLFGYYDKSPWNNNESKIIYKLNINCSPIT